MAHGRLLVWRKNNNGNNKNQVIVAHTRARTQNKIKVIEERSIESKPIEIYLFQGGLVHRY